MQQETKSTTWHLQEVIWLALIGIAFGLIYWLMDSVYQVTGVLLGAVGLQPLNDELTLGPWMMAGPLASYLLRRIGAGVLGELLGASGEMLLGGTFGVSTLLSGVIQGVGSELGFALTGYRNWKAGLWLSTLTGTIVTFAWSMIKSGYLHYSWSMLLILFIARFISIFIFAGLLVYWIVNLLERSQILKKR
ncbi:ECF transporter S component [Convivina praedatoris]|uniref:HMP/thiamine permease protein YkoE n=1 Tax=Convivina praedatoris TaxID=2880963 RepID=A0ABN8HGU0_9LACO|nr:ECF transporter S component [Convivina sp. LMG 32447]CAH1853673.1 Putative HMP/thiamine permease protein YkoE [Convivina sp. LMG 32447]CAH1854700.1 Putative HMP/thiamine permease protein YkoE [Convivina sp. LMG 32447]CAH1855132.1 Putative HMP/thiamine permease protein YkoE [Convivina sp. LMG 32447]